MTTLTIMLDRVRSRLDESTTRFWTDAELTTWINEGARDIARRAEVLEATTTINTVANTQEYALPTNTLRVYRAEWSRDGATGTTVIPLEYRDFHSMDSVWWSNSRQGRGDPFYFTMWGFPPSLNMVLYPTPDVSVTAGIKLYYYRLPTAAASGSDEVECPSGWEDAILDYCEYSAWRKDGNQQWGDSKNLYEQKLNSLIETTRRWTDQAGTVTAGGGPLPRWIYDDGYYY